MALITILIVLFGVFVRFPKVYLASDFVKQPQVQDVGLMVILGLGLRFSCLYKFAWSSIGSAYVLTAICALFYTLWHGLWSRVFSGGFTGEIELRVPELIDMYRAGAVGIIASSAAIGTVSLLENSLMVTLLMITYTLNKTICEVSLRLVDTGGTITIHLFAAAAGITYAKMMHSKYADNHPNNRRSYIHLNFAMVGTVILWVLYPSFNAGLITGLREQLAFDNTIIALCGAFITAIATNLYVNDRVVVNQLINSALAGAIAVGSTCSFTINFAISFGEGAVAGLVVAVLSSFLESRITSIDSMSVASGHLVAGLLGGIFSVIFALGYQLVGFPTFDPAWFTPIPASTFASQAGLQFVCMLVTLFIGGLSGISIGGALRLLGFVSVLETDFGAEAIVVVQRMEDGQQVDVEERVVK